MRPLAYDIVSLALLLGSVFFLYRAVEFLAQKDYVAGVLTIAAGFLVIRGGAEVGRLAIVARGEGDRGESSGKRDEKKGEKKKGEKKK